MTKRNKNGKVLGCGTHPNMESFHHPSSEVVRKNYENQTGEVVTKSYVDRVLKDAGLVRSPQKKREAHRRRKKDGANT